MPQFDRYIGIDYSGAATPNTPLSELRVFSGDAQNAPTEERPLVVGNRRHWTRRGIAEWLERELMRGERVIIGIDHCFSFPEDYFDKYAAIGRDWGAFLNDFHRHWPTDRDDSTVENFRRVRAHEVARNGDESWFRLTETWIPGAKSAFQFDVPGSVAKSTHAGLPWLRYLRQRVPDAVHFWPFDGWTVPNGRSVVAEVYPSLWMRRFLGLNHWTGDQHAAYAAASWLQHVDAVGVLSAFLQPALNPEERQRAEIEGWILGVF